MSRRVEIGWGYEGEDYRVVCSVGPEQSEIRFGEHAQEGLAGEVEILSITEDAPGGAERPDLLEAAQADFARIEERATVEAAESEESEWDAEQDRRYDAARDERRFGC